jgi:hypothetical protein
MSLVAAHRRALEKLEITKAAALTQFLDIAELKAIQDPDVLQDAQLAAAEESHALCLTQLEVLHAFLQNLGLPAVTVPPLPADFRPLPAAPRPLKYVCPKDLEGNKFKEGVTNHLTMFKLIENIMVIAGYDDTYFKFALMTKVSDSPEPLQWLTTLHKEHPFMAWDEIKTLFNDRWTSEDALDKFMATFWIICCTKFAHAVAFVDELHALLVALDINPNSHLATACALHRLPPNISMSVKFHFAQSGICLRDVTWLQLRSKVALVETQARNGMALSFQSTSSKPRDTSTCTFCKRHGHTEDVCKTKIRGLEPPSYPKVQPPAPPKEVQLEQKMATSSSYKNHVICHTCKEPGHISPQCPQRNTGAAPLTKTMSAFSAHLAAPPLDLWDPDVAEELNQMFAQPGNTVSDSLAGFMVGVKGAHGIKVPCSINGQNVLAYIDSGNAVTCVNSSLFSCDSAGITKLSMTSQDFPLDPFLEFGNGAKELRPAPWQLADMQFGTRSLSSFKVEPRAFPPLLADCAILIGLQDFSLLGLSIVGLPVSFPDTPVGNSRPHNFPLHPVLSFPDYDSAIVHCPGVLNGLSDRLSRCYPPFSVAAALSAPLVFADDRAWTPLVFADDCAWTLVSRSRRARPVNPTTKNN